MDYHDPFFQLMRDALVLASLVYVLALLVCRLRAGIQHDHVTRSFSHQWLGHGEPTWIRHRMRQMRDPQPPSDPALLAEFQRCIYERRIGLRTT